MNKQLEIIRTAVFDCRKCGLNVNKKNYVFGAGNEESDIMFIGEAPGANEDKQGLPFVGRSGKILDELLASIDLARGDIYICNVLKCRPPENRNPQPDEIILCTPYLNKQIDIINPKVICPLGAFSTSFIMKRYGLEKHGIKISVLHGKVFRVSTINGQIYIIPLYHPAVAAYNPEMKKFMLEDLKVLQDVASKQTKEKTDKKV